MIGPSRELAIDLRYVEKVYRRRIHALRGIQMQVRPGEIFGLLGPNGAGKSTLVKIIMTVVRPNRAEGTVLGRPVGHKPTLAKVGYLPENHHFPPYLTGRQALEYYAAMAQVDRATRKRRAGELLETVGMAAWADSPVGAYSKGMQQRIGLAQALVNDPQLVVLDEPTDGLDPVGRREIRDVLRRLREEGRTVFLNSHLLGEVEQVCDRVAILVQGKVVRQGTIEDLTSRGRYHEIRLHAASPDGLREAVRAAIPCEFHPQTPAAGTTPPRAAPAAVETGTLASGESVELDGNAVRILTTDPAAIQPVIDALRKNELMIRSIALVRQSLEDYFIATVGEPSGGGSAAAASPFTPRPVAANAPKEAHR